VSAYTSNAPGVDAVEFRTATNIPFVAANRFVTFSVDVAAVNCGVSAPLLQFHLIDQNATSTPAGVQINGCSSASSQGRRPGPPMVTVSRSAPAVRK
jgi:hypothetical protein